ncbi:MAG: hypothetical protein HY513_04735 [Candidatus Aenigmarchaeota archaeon]|nr:hypothetical protein [Candidatus Aenigmarchaeota archaeon]
MKITKKMLEEYGMEVFEIRLSGKSKLAKTFEALYVGKWVSYFLALEYGVDPEKVDMVENFKKELDKI